MELDGSLEEEFKFNTPVHSPRIITYSSSPPPFLEQVSNPAADISLVSENNGIEAKKYGAQVSNPAADIILVSENDGIGFKKDGATETVFWYKGVK